MNGVKILKFKNQEAYLYGETQLIYFSDVRESLKANQDIELVLMNVDSSIPGVMKNKEDNQNDNRGSKKRYMSMNQGENIK